MSASEVLTEKEIHDILCNHDNLYSPLAKVRGNHGSVAHQEGIAVAVERAVVAKLNAKGVHLYSALELREAERAAWLAALEGLDIGTYGRRWSDDERERRYPLPEKPKVPRIVEFAGKSWRVKDGKPQWYDATRDHGSSGNNGWTLFSAIAWEHAADLAALLAHPFEGDV